MGDNNCFYADHVTLNDNTMKSVADRIHLRRKELGLTLQEVADRANINKSTLQRYEKGSIKNIPLSKLDGLSAALNTSRYWILGFYKDADSVTPVDIRFLSFLRYLGIDFPGLELGPMTDDTGAKELPMISYTDNKSCLISKDDYRLFRDKICSYIRFEANELLKNNPV